MNRTSIGGDKGEDRYDGLAIEIRLAGYFLFLVVTH